MALRRRPAPKLSAPSFNLNLPVGEVAQQQPLKLDEPVQQKVAEQLIVDLDAGTVDSPFIAMSGTFPGNASQGAPPPPGAAGMPTASNAGGMGAPSRSSGGGSTDFSVQPTGAAVATTPPPAPASTASTTSGDDSAGSPGAGRIPRAHSNPVMFSAAKGTTEFSPGPGGMPPRAATTSTDGMQPPAPAAAPAVPAVASIPQNPAAAAAKREKADAAAKAASMRSQRRFFRVDNSNMYVLVNQGHDADQEDGPKGVEAPLVEGPANDADSNIPFDDFEMGEILGSGSQGSVRAVSHNGKHYALKRISISLALDKTQADVERQARKKAIVRELQMLANRQNRHQNLVALYNGYFRKDIDEGSLHILMERMSISAETLQHLISFIPPNELKATAQRVFANSFGGQQRISNGQTLYCTHHADIAKVRITTLPENVISMIAHDALTGLAHLHSTLRFVHVDLKPANFMFDMGYTMVKLADFGCSQQLPPMDTTSDGRGFISVSNVNLGTKLYMSPERAAACFGAEGGSFNEGTDIWSLGMSLLELAAGCHPCHEFREDYWDFAEKLDVRNLIFPEQCSSLFNDFICLMLTRPLDERPSAAELLKHDFIKKYAAVPRKKLALFLRTTKQMSATYEQKKLQSAIATHLTVATKTKDKAPSHRNIAAWRGFQKGIVGDVPKLDDDSLFPSL